MAAITFTRSVFEHCKQPNGAYRARRTPYYNNLSLVVEAGHAYIIGNRGRKSITVKPSKKEPNRILVGLRLAHGRKTTRSNFWSRSSFGLRRAPKLMSLIFMSSP